MQGHTLPAEFPAHSLSLFTHPFSQLHCSCATYCGHVFESFITVSSPRNLPGCLY